MKNKGLGILFIYLICCQLVWGANVPNIQSEGGILIEPKTNTVLYAKNEDRKFYPASITKILTALICAEEMAGDTRMIKTAEAVRGVPSDSSHIGLQIGDSFNTKNALYGLMLGSDNFIAYDLAVKNAGSIKTFAAKMNEKAKSLGAKHSNFVNPHGYHATDHYTTAYDMAQIARVAFDNAQVMQIAGTRTFPFKVANKNKTINIKNTSRLLDSTSPYYNAKVVATKTGWHDDAGQTLVAKAMYGDIELIAVTMKTKTPNQYQDVNALFKYGSQNFSVNKQGGEYVLENKTYSQFGAPFVAYAKQNNWELPVAKNYQQPITYDEFVEVIGCVLGKEKVQVSLKKQGIVTGKENLKRKDAAYILQKVMTDLGVQPTIYHVSPYIPDLSSVEAKYQEAIQFTVRAQLLGSKDISFNPNQTINYEQALCVAYRMKNTCGGLNQ